MHGVLNRKDNGRVGRNGCVRLKLECVVMVLRFSFFEFEVRLER